jgi:hypothetical protein
VVAKCNHVHISEISQELPSLLAKGSRLEEAIRGYTLVPELFDIFQRCRRSLSDQWSAA